MTSCWQKKANTPTFALFNRCAAKKGRIPYTQYSSAYRNRKTLSLLKAVEYRWIEKLCSGPWRCITLPLILEQTRPQETTWHTPLGTCCRVVHALTAGALRRQPLKRFLTSPRT